MGRSGTPTGGSTSDPVGTTLRRAADQYISARRPTAAPSTLKGTRYTLEFFCEAIGPTLLVRALKQRHIEKWMGLLDVAPSTLATRLGIVRSFTKWLVASGYIKYDPCALVAAPTRRSTIRRGLTRAEVEKVIRSCPDARAVVVWLLAANLGLRRGEIVNLRVGEVNLNDQMILVPREGKTGERWVPIGAATLEAIALYLASYPATGSETLVRSYNSNGPLHPDHVSRIIGQVMYDAGIKVAPYDGKCLHSGRHTTAIELVDQGVDVRVVQQVLGHQSLASTLPYTKRRIADRELRDAMATREEYRPL